MSHFLTASIFFTLALDRLNPFVAAFTNRVKSYHKIYSKIKKKSCQETRSRVGKEEGTLFVKVIL